MATESQALAVQGVRKAIDDVTKYMGKTGPQHGPRPYAAYQEKVSDWLADRGVTEVDYPAVADLADVEWVATGGISVPTPA